MCQHREPEEEDTATSADESGVTFTDMLMALSKEHDDNDQFVLPPHIKCAYN